VEQTDVAAGMQVNHGKKNLTGINPRNIQEAN
jgi:hypothetical protein